MSRRQCRKCPWKADVDPHDIPRYDEPGHIQMVASLENQGGLQGVASNELHMMACHETPTGGELPCVGWLVHELGPGNNLALRMQVLAGRIDCDVETVGEQRNSIRETLP